MYHYLYKITNKINNKIYIGIHSTDNLEDGYMGSGKAILRAINKYGKDKFTKDLKPVQEQLGSLVSSLKELVTPKK